MHIRTVASISGLVTVLVTACAPPTPSTSPAPQVVTVGASASSSASPTDTPTDMSQALAAASASVGQIRSTTCDGGWTGTGFLVSDQLILTAAHVVEGAHALTITFPDDEPRPVFVVGYRPDNDIALLRLDESVERPYLALADTAATIAQPVGVVGYPLGKSAQHVNTGIVSSVEDSAELNGHMIKRVLSLDAAINHGNSGGPVINNSRQVVGLISGTFLDPNTEEAAEGFHFAIPANRLRMLLDRYGDADARPFAECEEEGRADAPLAELLVRSDDEYAEELGTVLWTHGQAINESRYEAAWNLFTGSMQSRLKDMDDWASGLSTTYWLVVEVREVSELTDERAVVRTFVRTEQGAADGPDGQTCSIWPLNYTLVWNGDEWLIDKATLRAKATACE